MKRFATLSLVAALAACGGGEPPANTDATSQPAAAPAAAAQPAAPTGEMTMPDWFSVDDAAKTATMTITAGLTDAVNHWNFNGGHNGNMAITVPEGYAVTIHFKNADPNGMAHSLGIIAAQSTYGAMLEPNPVFPGAISDNPTSMTDGLMPGNEEDVTFTAATAGDYAMVCFIPGHAAAGMWVHFNVSSDGSSGVQGAQM
jgi:sulfocyanin